MGGPFGPFFAEISTLEIAQKTHEKFVGEYLSEKTFFCNVTDATKIPLREKAVKKVKEEPKVKYKSGWPKKGETREPIKPKILEQQKNMKTVDKMFSLASTECGVGIKQNSKNNRDV